MTKDSFLSDIPLDLAVRAHAGTSHTPEKRGQQEREDYAAQMANDWQELSALANDYNAKTALAHQFAKYRARMASLKMAELHARSRCVSTMIAGPAKFPVRRAQKASDAADKRRQELLDYRTRAMAEMRRALCPGDAPIMSGDDDAVERLRAKLVEAEATQKLMVGNNKAARMAICWRGIVYPDHKIRNNGAEIRRLRRRIEAVTAAKATPATSAEGDGVRMEDDPAANRVRLFFADKPSTDMRARLKRCGYRWTPSLGCWQAYRSIAAMPLARELTNGAEAVAAGASER